MRKSTGQDAIAIEIIEWLRHYQIQLLRDAIGNPPGEMI
jgi:hypothetical protein